ncbi:hypothetical protein CTAYLR_002652 [Chrysophaeum taylorii]|uniref:Nucleotide-diphospho-sugar transferase domain-containing protein n=1 Tax=Chrysophaeum taylorii TaxID=2483200 RepID=A0AAD7UE09_9STRA|nr:hypothetical protein CTAYLR_002652 [Chrysophaeum taylorii]
MITPSVVVVVACSAHYTDFFENWLAWVSRLDTDEMGFVAIAEDVEAYGYLRRRFEVPGGYRRVVRAAAGGAAPPLKGALGFESAGFATLMSRRAAHLAAQLAQLAEAWESSQDARLIFSDLDVLWIRDPRPWLERRTTYSSGRPCDAWAQTQHRERGLLNPGFLALAPTPGAAALLREWERRLRERPQRNLPVFNEAIRALKGTVHVCALAPDLFLSAKRSFRRANWMPLADRRAARMRMLASAVGNHARSTQVVAHANWIDGHDVR